MDTEVVIWSSKVQYSPPPASDHAHWSGHAPWSTQPNQDQPEVSWMPQRETEPFPVSNAVDISTVTPYNRCANVVEQSSILSKRC